MKHLAIILFAFIAFFTSDRTKNDYEKEIRTFQKELNENYLDPDGSPLSTKQRKKFKKKGGHQFFPINQNYKVTAKLVKTDKKQTIKMNTSTTRIATYQIYAVAEFQLDGKDFSLNIYQSLPKDRRPPYQDHLFLPFTDLTSGNETYGGGRYVDLSTKDVDGETITIDFNKSYHPYCAYTDRFSCPVPPRENRLKTRVEAGIRSLDYELK